MKATYTDIQGLIILEPRVFADNRGFFFESYNGNALAALGIDISFVQDNHSSSRRGTLRGIHYQVVCPQAKLVRVVVGEVFDVAVDLRKSSPTFGRWFGIILSASNKLQLYIPVGFGHGFLALSDTAEVLYKASDFYAPAHERCIRWNDPDLAIDWPSAGELTISEKDAGGSLFREADLP
jgi:dTDP-4-dehydrorhamnose 3,5-epimerase